jgi:large subunit ribosomal protein L18
MNKQLRKKQALVTKRRRVRKKVSGTADRPRLSVYRSEANIYGQLIDDESGLTLASVSTISKDLRDQVKDLDPTAAAKAVGEALASKAQEKGISLAVFDRGGRRYAGRIAALAEGARGKGLQF